VTAIPFLQHVPPSNANSLHHEDAAAVVADDAQVVHRVSSIEDAKIVSFASTADEREQPIDGSILKS